MKLIEYILSTIAPHECLGCRSEGTPLCPACCAGLSPVVPRCYRCQRSQSGFRTCGACRRSTRLFAVQSVTTYDGLAKELVRKIKFERLRMGAEPIADLLAALRYEPDEVIAHIPTATSRVRQRGYDQAALIARGISRRTGLVHASLLARLGQQRQVGKSRKERKAQMNELFFVVGNVKNRNIILVDDVVTTGATLEACASALKIAGAKRVSAVVFAAA
ncbi:MAG: ComF family protein [Candidatus Saccharimonadales bacterium]